MTGVNCNDKLEAIVIEIEKHVQDMAEMGNDVDKYIDLLYYIFRTLDNKNFYFEHTDWLEFASGDEPDLNFIENNRTLVLTNELVFSIIDKLILIGNEEIEIFRKLMDILDSLEICEYCLKSGVLIDLVPEKWHVQL